MDLLRNLKIAELRTKSLELVTEWSDPESLKVSVNDLTIEEMRKSHLPTWNLSLLN